MLSFRLQVVPFSKPLGISKFCRKFCGLKLIKAARGRVGLKELSCIRLFEK
jgi:hypothetical protein